MCIQGPKLPAASLWTVVKSQGSRLVLHLEQEFFFPYLLRIKRNYIYHGIIVLLTNIAWQPEIVAAQSLNAATHITPNNVLNAENDVRMEMKLQLTNTQQSSSPQK